MQVCCKPDTGEITTITGDIVRLMRSPERGHGAAAAAPCPAGFSHNHEAPAPTLEPPEAGRRHIMEDKLATR